MPLIRQLPPSVVNKIAAGEVIERPASVVKELLENAIDAGAARIEVSLQAGGMELIRVADDGCGIEAEQLPLAVASHATSKLRDADDLFRVATLGFRGEALASIAEVSQLLLRSRPAAAAGAAELEVDGGRVSPVVPCGAPVGTTLEVRNLFFNTPVRRKFLRSVPTEVGHASEAFTRIALAAPRVHLVLRHNDRVLFDLPPCDNWRERIAAFFGRELEAALLPVDSADGDVRLSGYVADPQHSRSTNKLQYLLLNGRHIRDRSLQHALSEAYRGLLLTGRFPIAFLQLEMPPEAVDVNVHPTKLEVRFADSGRLYSQLLGTIRKKFLTTDLTARVGAPAGEAAAAMDAAAAERHRRELVDWAQGQLRGPAAAAAGSATALAEEDSQALLELRFDQRPGGDLAAIPFDRSAWLTSPALAGSAGSPGQAGSPALAETPRLAPGEETSQRRDPAAGLPRSHLGFQIHNKYLVTESDEGMVVIDQHALHERILYEKFRQQALGGRLETQRLLVPEPVPLAPAEAAAVRENQPLLARLGIEAEPFGGDTVLVTAYPAMLASVNPAELLRQAVERLTAGGPGPERRDLLDELLHMMSCKAAVKAGDPLAPEEITALLEQRHLCQDAHHCPHGRPTALVFTRDELDRRFKRI